MAADQDKTIAACKTAIQMEIDGKDFYLKTSQACRNEPGRKLLERLAAEEDIHRRVFERIFDNISHQQGWPEQTDFQPDGGQGLRNVFAKALETADRNMQTIPDELKAIETAMTMENKTYDYYVAQGKEATYEAEKAFYTALAAQEKEHHRVLLDYYDFMKDPAGWFVQKEHPSLDGG